MSATPTWPEVALGAIGTLQTVLLAYMATRSRRVRATDRRGDHERPPDSPEAPSSD